MDVDQIEQRRVAEELVHKTAIEIRKAIDYAVSEANEVLDFNVEERIQELVFD